MDKSKLAKRINSSVSWITRALSGDPKARQIRSKIAASVSRTYARKLGLSHEWRVANQLQKMVHQMDTVFGTIDVIENKFITRGIQSFVKR